MDFKDIVVLYDFTSSQRELLAQIEMQRQAEVSRLMKKLEISCGPCLRPSPRQEAALYRDVCLVNGMYADLTARVYAVMIPRIFIPAEVL